MENENIQKRTLRFSINLTRFISKLNKNDSLRILLNQLLRSGTSVGANLEEADSAVSRKDFINKIAISKKEARETKYWLTIIRESCLINSPKEILELSSHIKEIDEIIKIVGTIYYRTKNECAKHTSIGHY